MKLRILFVALICGVASLAADAGAELFQKAVTQEQAAGNLQEAIKLYQRVAKEYASNRALAAKALIQAARCYEKLGEDKGTKLYEQVARDFSDQTEQVAAARARLAALKQQAAPVTMTARRLDSPSSGFEPSFFVGDGQRSFFRDRNTLVIGDAAGNNKRTIHTFKPDHDRGINISRDFSTILLQEGPVGGPMSMALIKSDGTGYRDLGQSGTRVWYGGWSWDNKYVILVDPEKDGSTRLIRLTIADGRRQEVLRRENATVDIAQFSPDGRFIAFAEGPADSSRIFVVPSAGGEPVPVIRDASLLDWTRDGRYLAMISGRPGSRALYLLPIKEGHAAGEQVFIRNGSIEGSIMLASGALAYSSTSPPSGPVISIGSLGADGHVEGWKPLYLDNGLAVDPYPEWSPDGRQISYLAATVDAGLPVATLRLRDLTTGADRQLFRSNAKTSQLCVWGSKRPKIFCTVGTGASTDVIEVAPDTGVAEKLASLDGVWAMKNPSSDDSALYMYTFGKGLVRWQIETHEVTPLGGGGLDVSPDGRWVAMGGRPTEPQPDPALQYSLQLRPASSTDWRRVGTFKMEPWQHPGAVHVTFSHDGEWFYYHAKDAAGKDALFRVATAGGDPVRLGDLPSHAVEGTLRVSRDGRQVIVVAPDAATRRTESWLLENFEPKQTAAVRANP